MLRRQLGLFALCFSALALPVTACGSSDSDDGGGNGTGGGSSGKPDPVEEGKKPPALSGGNPGSATAPTALAVRKLFVGETDFAGNASLDAWKSFGYNLDGIISTKNGSNHCKPAKGANPANVKTDGDNGTDNSFGLNILKVIQQFEKNPSDAISQSLEDGDFTIILLMDKIDSEANQTNINTALHAGSEAVTKPPNWDGADVWKVAPELLNGGDIGAPKVSFPMSYVAGNTWVSGSPGTLDLSVSIQGFDLKLTITQAVITADLALGASPKNASKGIISGVIETAVLIDELKKVAGGFDKNLCEGQAFDSIAQLLRQASDIMKDGSNGDPAVECDAISIGLGFEAVEIAAPTEVADPATPEPDPCATPQ